MVTVNKALVVDDSKVVRVVLKRMLEVRGLGVDTVASGQEALDYLKGPAPDVIFIDYMMAGLDGYEVTAAIRKNPRTSTIPVFVCTGNNTPQEQLRAHECGANGIVAKPIVDAKLDALLAELRASAPLPFAAPAPITQAEIAVADPAEDAVRVAERVAHEVAERLVHEAIAALSATSEQTAESVAQRVAASTTQVALASWHVEVAKANERAEHVAVAAAEQVAQTIMHRAAAEAQAARQDAQKVVDEKLREAMLNVESIAERVARETLDSAKTAIEDGSRQVLDSTRADLQQTARIAAEAAAKPVAEAVARTMIEQLVRETLAAAREEEAASRSRVEQTTIAVVERVGRELVQLVFSAAVSKGQASGGERIHAMESLRAQGEELFDEQVDTADAQAAEVTFQTREDSDTTLAETASITTSARQHRRFAMPAAWTAPGPLLPWLAALTLAVLYLLVRSFL